MKHHETPSLTRAWKHTGQHVYTKTISFICSPSPQPWEAILHQSQGETHDKLIQQKEVHWMESIKSCTFPCVYSGHGASLPGVNRL